MRGINGLFLGLAVQELHEPGAVRIDLYGDIITHVLQAMSDPGNV